MRSLCVSLVIKGNPCVLRHAIDLPPSARSSHDFRRLRVLTCWLSAALPSAANVEQGRPKSLRGELRFCFEGRVVQALISEALDSRFSSDPMGCHDR